MLRANLTACLFYVSRHGFYIRSMIPSTFQHQPFTDPVQRLYLSATLGDAGELERAFGRTDIQRVPVPPVWDRTGSGRRFFVFPDLAPTPAGAAASQAQTRGRVKAEDDAHEQGAGVVGDLLDLAEKRFVLTPDDDSARRIADLLGVPATQRYTAKDADTGIIQRSSTPRAARCSPERFQLLRPPAC